MLEEMFVTNTTHLFSSLGSLQVEGHLEGGPKKK